MKGDATFIRLFVENDAAQSLEKRIKRIKQRHKLRKRRKAAVKQILLPTCLVLNSYGTFTAFVRFVPCQTCRLDGLI